MDSHCASASRRPHQQQVRHVRSGYDQKGHDYEKEGPKGNFLATLTAFLGESDHLHPRAAASRDAIHGDTVSDSFQFNLRLLRRSAVGQPSYNLKTVTYLPRRAPQILVERKTEALGHHTGHHSGHSIHDNFFANYVWVPPENLLPYRVAYEDLL